tara:strand:+ start:486 stop:824 length:339 start_codon:yes stop_codon:yes gene_type:complete
MQPLHRLYGRIQIDLTSLRSEVIALNKEHKRSLACKSYKTSLAIGEEIIKICRLLNTLMDEEQRLLQQMIMVNRAMGSSYYAYYFDGRRTMFATTDDDGEPSHEVELSLNNV